MVPIAVGISVLSMVAIMVWFQARRDVDVLADIRGFDAGVIPIAIGLHLLMHVLWAGRLHVLANGFHVPLRAVAAWRLATAGQFGGAVTPGRLGAEGMRLSLLARSGATATQASRIVLADRATDMVFFLGAGTVVTVSLAAAFGPEALAVQAIAITGLALLLAFMLLVIISLVVPHPIAWLIQAITTGLWRIVRRTPPKIRHRISDFLHNVRLGMWSLLRERPWRIGVAIVLSMAIWMAEFGVLWMVLKGFGHTLDFPLVVGAGIILTILGPVAGSPGGAGVVEVAAVILLGGLTAGLTPAFVLVWRALTYYYDIVVGGLVAVWALREGRADAADGVP